MPGPCDPGGLGGFGWARSLLSRSSRKNENSEHPRRDIRPPRQLLVDGSTAINFGFRNCQAPPWHPMVQLMQHVLDGGDPIGLAPFAVAAPLAGQKARNVLMFEAIADDVVPNESTEALARAMGLRLAEPALSALADIPRVSGVGATNVPSMGATSVLVQLSPAAHGSHVVARKGARHYALTRARFGDPSVEPFPLLPKPIEFENPYLETQDASIRFIDEAFAAKAPTLNWSRVPMAPKD